MSNIEYVIYCRKSTDESSGQQTQSIPDQIKKCVENAEKEGLTLKEKPKDFSDFETEREIWKEDNESDIYNKRIYQESRKRFIIKEQESAKIPWKRPKWRRLMNLIKQGKIKGLLSYSPDRQARNMMEWGELLNCVDEWLIDLKYTNFHFENTASGKMMLGIWFVFSKQYSDKLSEDVSRGNKTAVARGKAMGRDKHWYIRDDQEHFRPDGKNFELMRQAFEMKLYQNKSDLAIADRLNAHWFTKKSGKKMAPASYKHLYRVWFDSFYYGIHIYGNNISDLRQADVGFQPIISEEEHRILFDRYQGSKPKLTIKEIKEEHEEIIGIPRGLLKMIDWSPLLFNLPNKQRFYKKLEELKKTKPEATLKDVVKSKQCRYKAYNKNSKHNGFEVTFDIIEKAILEKLSHISLNREQYNKFVYGIANQLDDLNAKRTEERTKNTFQINRITSDKTKFIVKNMWYKKNEEEQRIYDQEIKKYDEQIDYLQKEWNQLTLSERNTVYEFQALMETIQSASKRYKKFDFVQKRRLAEILFSNIVVDTKKRLTFEVNPILEWLFIRSSRRSGIRTPDLVLKRDLL